jgi:hypothetical protein
MGYRVVTITHLDCPRRRLGSGDKSIWHNPHAVGKPFRECAACRAELVVPADSREPDGAAEPADMEPLLARLRARLAALKA